MTAHPYSSAARRYGSLAWFAAALLAPSVPVFAALVGIAVVAALAPGIRRLLSRQRRGREPQPAGGVVLGPGRGGRPVSLSDQQLAAHAVIVGASGAGKTTTLLQILGPRIQRGLPVVALDLKGSPSFAAELERAATAAGRRLRVWTPEGGACWNPLAYGNPTALKDKLIGSERFSEPHYQRAAERYVQTVLQVLHAARPGVAPQLHEVVALCEPRRLGSVLRGVPLPLAERVQDYLAGMTPDQLSAARGLGTRLALLSESTAGEWLRSAPGAIDLGSALEGGDVVLFSLNSSVYGKLAAQLGALAIQDLVSASGHRLERAGGAPVPPATVAIDEFSALGADHVLALLARGREAGVSLLVATQELADLERAGRGFADQVLGITGVKIVHRQEVPASANTIAQLAGTEWRWERTEQLRSPFAPGGASRGSRRLVEQFVVHPNEIKTLETGQAVVITRLPHSSVARVRVARAGPGRAGGTARPERSPGLER